MRVCVVLEHRFFSRLTGGGPMVHSVDRFGTVPAVFDEGQIVARRQNPPSDAAWMDPTDGNGVGIRRP